MKRRLPTGWLRTYGVLFAFVILFLANAILQPGVFLQPENLKNLLNQNVAVGFIAIGMTFVIISGGIDLAVGSLLAFAATAGMIFMNSRVAGGASEGSAVLLGAVAILATSILGGLMSGLIVVYGRIVPFVATLIGLLAYRSMALALAEGGEVRSASAEVFAELGRGGIAIPFLSSPNGKPLILNWTIIGFVVLVLVTGFMLNRLAYGKHVIAIGSNERAARYSGINIAKVKLWTYTFSGFCVGLGAIATATRLNSISSSSSGLYYELDAIAAVVIGGTSLNGGYGRIWGTFVGVLLLGLINNTLNLIGFGAYWPGAVKGAIILLAVLLQRPAKDV